LLSRICAAEINGFRAHNFQLIDRTKVEGKQAAEKNPFKTPRPSPSNQ